MPASVASLPTDFDPELLQVVALSSRHGDKFRGLLLSGFFPMHTSSPKEHQRQALFSQTSASELGRGTTIVLDIRRGIEGLLLGTRVVTYTEPRQAVLLASTFAISTNNYGITSSAPVDAYIQDLVLPLEADFGELGAHNRRVRDEIFGLAFSVIGSQAMSASVAARQPITLGVVHGNPAFGTEVLEHQDFKVATKPVETGTFGSRTWLCTRTYDHTQPEQELDAL